MKTKHLALLIPCWLGCGSVVDLGPVDGPKADAKPTTDFEPELLEFEPWDLGICARFSDDSIYCWRYGQTVAKKVVLSGVSFSPNTERMCAVQRSGGVACVDLDCNEKPGYCWFSDIVYEVPGIASAVEVSTLAIGGIALLSDGRVQLWCDHVQNCFGPGGVGLPMAIEQQYGSSVVGEPFGVDEPIAKLARTSWFGFVTAEGHAYSHLIWPDETTIRPVQLPGGFELPWPPVRVPGVDDALAFVGSGFILRRSGRILAFGTKDVLGIGSNERTVGSGEVLTIDDAVAIASNGGGSCAIRSDGSLWCWGWGIAGSLGVIGPPGPIGTYEVTLPSPVRVSSVEAVRAVGMQGALTCVVRGANEVLCWGWHGLEGPPSTTPYRVMFQ